MGHNLTITHLDHIINGLMLRYEWIMTGDNDRFTVRFKLCQDLHEFLRQLRIQMGRRFIGSVSQREYFLLTGLTLIYAVMLILGNIFVDIVYAWLDPRIRFD